VASRAVRRPQAASAVASELDFTEPNGESAIADALWPHRRGAKFRATDGRRVDKCPATDQQDVVRFLPALRSGSGCAVRSFDPEGEEHLQLGAAGEARLARWLTSASMWALEVALRGVSLNRF